MVKRAINVKILNKIKLLKEEEKLYDYLKDIYFKTEDDFQKFFEENHKDLIKLNMIKIRIKELEISLMTEEEKQKHIKYLEDLKEKFR